MSNADRELQNGEKEINICKELVPANYLNLANQAINSTHNVIKELLEKRKLPMEGWSELLIEDLVRRLSSRDSNNFPHNLGFGEREARIYCPMVARRHYYFGHGIGRSGNLSEAQPKAAGSTIMANLTNSLLLDLIHLNGLKCCKKAIIVPCATGMTLMLCLLALKKQRPNAKYVLWSRIDQKSCFKSITSAGLIPIIIEPKLETEKSGYIADESDFETVIKEKGVDNIVCIFSTTSCFAPRNFDPIMPLALLANKYNVPHLVNNAYGLQCPQSIGIYLDCAQSKGRVDFIVQSTDKNLMVPVGGAIVASSQKENVESVAEMYAGRASSSQTLDVLMTLLSMGYKGYQKLTEERTENFYELVKHLNDFAESNETKVIPTKLNDISIALDLKHLKSFGNVNPTKLGSMLYSRGVSGARVIASGDDRTIDGYLFKNWGAHSSDFTGAYITFAVAIGSKASDIPKLIEKLKDCHNSLAKEQAKNTIKEQ